jgi:hypothetical protein
VIASEASEPLLGDGARTMDDVDRQRHSRECSRSTPGGLAIGQIAGTPVLSMRITDSVVNERH